MQRRFRVSVAALPPSREHVPKGSAHVTFLPLSLTGKGGSFYGLKWKHRKDSSKDRARVSLAVIGPHLLNRHCNRNNCLLAFQIGFGAVHGRSITRGVQILSKADLKSQGKAISCHAVLILIGSGIGITAALASGSLLRAFLYGTGARNPHRELWSAGAFTELFCEHHLPRVKRCVVCSTEKDRKPISRWIFREIFVRNGIMFF